MNAMSCTARITIIAITVLGWGGLSNAQNYPSSPIRIVSPYPPGGGTDALGRAIGQRITEKSGFPVVIDNRPGANGIIGTGVAAKAAPDGHTMVIVAAAYAAGSSLYKSLPYDPVRDLAPVTLLSSGPLILVVHPSLPPRTTKELVQFAKSRPGEFSVASSGVGSLPHLSLELFALTAGIKLVHIPYKGPVPALIDIIGGQVSMYFVNATSGLPYIKSGKLRALGVTSIERSAIAPHLPTIAESGLRGFDMTNWYGLLVPAATPKNIVLRLEQEVRGMLALPEFKTSLALIGMTAVAGTQGQFAEFLTKESTKYAKVIQAAGIKPE